MRRYLFSGCLLFCCLAMALTVMAPSAASADSGKFSRTVTAVDPVTLQGQGLTITLWGVKPVMSPAIELKALDLMDNLIDGSPVTCQAVGGTSTNVVARCNSARGDDLGLSLLNHGFVVVDRRQNVGAVPSYLEAQQAARHNAAGIWKQVVKSDGMSQGTRMFLGILPVAAVLLMMFVVLFRLRSLETQQKEEFEQTRSKETQLLAREKHVLASTLEGELAGNKNRIEAFLTIYRDMLANLKSTTETPKYKEAGDIVQKHPALSKAVFEASVSKLSLLDMKLAARLSKLYAALPMEQEYINIEPGVPLESAVALVEKVIRDAEIFVQPLTDAIAALEGVMKGSTTPPVAEKD